MISASLLHKNAFGRTCLYYGKFRDVRVSLTTIQLQGATPQPQKQWPDFNICFSKNTGEKNFLAGPAPESDFTHSRLITGKSQMLRFAGENILITG